MKPASLTFSIWASLLALFVIGPASQAQESPAPPDKSSPNEVRSSSGGHGDATAKAKKKRGKRKKKAKAAENGASTPAPVPAPTEK